jgi:hypothetical protein
MHFPVQEGLKGGEEGGRKRKGGKGKKRRGKKIRKIKNKNKI